MKKILSIALVLALLAGLAAAFAEDSSDDLPALEFADMIYHEYLGRISDPEDEISYVFMTAEDGELEPGDADPEPYLSILAGAALAEADITEAPEGEFIVMSFPEQCQVDFFLGEPEKNYIRLTVFADVDEVCLAQLVFPEGTETTAADVVQMWVDDLTGKPKG